ncbi:MAG: hypothetical protein ACP5O7_11935 [Phycisphaerae bacterium]
MKKLYGAIVLALCFATSRAFPTAAVAAKPASPAVLTASGKALMEHYASILNTLQGEISSALPSVDPGMTHPFMDAYRAEQTKKPYKLTNHAFTGAIARCQQTAAPILYMVDPFLSSNQYDKQLLEASVIADATPRGLAAFAQQSKANEDIINALLKDPALMMQIQKADGPRHGDYGLTMQIYNAIEHASPLAHKGILQRFALATALIQSPLQQWDPFHPVGRYLNFQNAYLKKELSPYFPTLTTWECRFVADEPYSNQQISWFRHMLMNYEPNNVMSGHYLNIVHTDVGYNHMHFHCVPGGKPAVFIAGGGECGARAWIARLAERSFGIPTWGVQQPGHAALTHWTPNGWVTRFAAGWDWIFWNQRSGLHFLLESQARAYPKKFMRVLRARWIGSALGEQKPDLRSYGTGGYWFAIADCEEREIIASGKPTYVTPSAAHLAEHNGPTLAQKLAAAEVPSSALEISVAANGVITIPAAAYRGHAGMVPGLTSMKSFSGGMQIYYHCSQPAGKKHHPFQYIVKATRPGTYEIMAKYNSIKPTEYLNLTVNHGSAPVTMTMPWTNGMWQVTKPVKVNLVKGENTLTFNRGKMTGYHARGIFAVSLKKFVLTPAE